MMKRSNRRLGFRDFAFQRVHGFRQAVVSWSLVGCLVAFAVPGYAADLAVQRQLFIEAEKALAKADFHNFDQLLLRLKDYPLYHYLLYKKLSSTPGAVEEIQKFASEFADTRYPTLLRNTSLRFFASQKDWHRYAAHYQKSVSPELKCHYHWALYQTGNRKKALDGARALWLVGRSQPSACDSLFEKLQHEKGIDSNMAWQRFALSLKRRNVRLAKYLTRFIPKEEISVAEFWIKVHQNPQRFLMDEKHWDRDDPRSAQIFIHGLNRMISANPAAALAIWSANQRKFQFNGDQRKAIERRLGINLAINKDPAAGTFLANIDIDGADLGLLEWRVRNALLRQNWKQVHVYLDQLPESEKAVSRWQFWRARALDETGDRAGALKIYKTVAKDRSFHGFLAADVLEKDYAWSDNPLELTDVEIAGVESMRNFAAAREFLKLDRQFLARSDWWYGVRKLDHRQILAAAKLAERWHWNQIAIFTIAKAKYWDDLGLRFPLSYKAAVFRNALRENLEPSLVYGVIRQESAFDQFAHSRAGARGLMQIMPRTGKQIARKLKQKWTSSRILFEPDINLKFGTSYLKTLLGKYNDRFPFAVAAYNAGGHRVDRWLQSERPIPTDIWIENIPFKETRNYVSTVLAYAVIYHKRLHGKLYRVSDLLGKIAPVKIAESKSN